MPSPFPGMDPWLESPLFFPGLHHHLITFIIQSLKERLPPPYFADSDDRIWVDFSHRYIEPDANVLKQGNGQPRQANGGIACVTRSEPILIKEQLVENDEVREAFINIYARQNDDEQIVT